MPSSHLQSLAALAHIENLSRDAARAVIRRAAITQQPAIDTARDTAITLRFAVADDATALAKLAQLDCADVPPNPVLMAEADGTARAAISLLDGSTIADPFHRTAAIVELLTARAEHLRTNNHPTRVRRIRRLLAQAIARAQ
jgi:hypothetical protein